MPKFFCCTAIRVCPPGIADTSNCCELHLGKTAADTKLLRSKVLAVTCRGFLIRKRCSSLLVEAAHANPVRIGPVVHAVVERCCRDHDSHSLPDRICCGHSPSFSSHGGGGRTLGTERKKGGLSKADERQSHTLAAPQRAKE